MSRTKAAIITGAGSGIGFEIARQLSHQGNLIVINDLDEALCNKAAEKIRAVGGTCIAIAGDAGETVVIDEMVRQAQKMGILWKTVANAGLTAYGDFIDCSEDKFDRLLKLNLKGSFFLLQRSAHAMIEQGEGGRMVTMSSVTAVQAHPSLAAYGMTKAALKMLARALVPELTPHGILVNSIAPGAVQTERTLSEDPDYGRKWGSIYPTGRTCLPEDIAKATLFLLSEDNEMINGQTLIVDGGWTTLGPVPGDIEFPT
ncbi:MAG: SDR family oxidoreductase [Saprospiraceae bacterium]|nr:SDR family oxidoreductase [Saprospiraceae bacterium]